LGGISVQSQKLDRMLMRADYTGASLEESLR
jgi:hypothetical protein